MMPVIHLRDQRRAWLNGVEQTGLFVDGHKIWSRPPPPRIEDFHGFGPGQMPIDLRMYDPSKLELAGNLVSTVQNAGAAGSIFNPSASGADRPVWDAAVGAVTFDGVSQFMAFANPPNLAGVHLLAMIRFPRAVAIGNLPVFDTGAGAIYYTDRLNQIDWRYQFSDGGAPARFGVTYDTWALAEIRVQNGRVTLYWNGVLRHTQQLTAIPRPVTRIGRTTQLGAVRFKGAMADIKSVICHPDHTEIALEPAVRLARRVMAERIGIALP